MSAGKSIRGDRSPFWNLLYGFKSVPFAQGFIPDEKPKKLLPQSPQFDITSTSDNFDNKNKDYIFSSLFRDADVVGDTPTVPELPTRTTANNADTLLIDFIDLALPRKRRQAKQPTKSFIENGDTLVECWGKHYPFQSPVPVDACNRTKLMKPVTPAPTTTPPPPPERKNSAFLITVIWFQEGPRRYVHDIVFKSKVEMLNDITKNKVKLAPEELAPLQDLTRPTIIYVKLKSEWYIKIFGGDRFVYELWIKVWLALVKGPTEAVKLSKEYTDLEWDEPIKDTPAGTLQLIKLFWGGENPIFTFISILFPKAGTEPQVIVMDVFPDGKSHPPPPTPLVKIIQPTNMVSITPVAASTIPATSLSVSSYKFNFDPSTYSPSRETTFLCAFTPEHKSCIPDRPEASYLVTIIFNIEPDGRRRVTDVVMEDKKELLEEAVKKKLKPEDIAVLKDTSGPALTYMKLQSEPYKKIFGGDRFNLEPWLKHFQETTKGPAAAAKVSPDLQGIEVVAKPLKDLSKGTLFPVQVTWGGENPIYTLVATLFPKPAGDDPDVIVLDVFPDGKTPTPFNIPTTPKIVKPTNMVNIRDVAPLAAPKSKINPDSYSPEFTKPKGPPRETTFLCAFNPDNKACLPDRPEASYLVTVIFNIEPDGRRRITDVAFQNKANVLDNLNKENKKLKPEELAPLKDTSGPGMTYMRIYSEAYTKVFGSEKFNFEAWTKHYIETQKGPAAAAKASPDLKGIEVTERPLKDLPAGTLYPIQMNWGGDNPTMSLVGTIFPKQLTLDPDVYILDVFPDSKLPGPIPLPAHPKIVRPTNMVTIKEVNPTSAPQSKVNPETHSPDMNRPPSKTPPREATFFCAFNPDNKACLSERPEASYLVTVIFNIEPDGRRRITDVAFQNKANVLENLNKENKKLKPEELAPLKDNSGPGMTYMRIYSEAYTKVFGSEKFNFEAWCKHYIETQKGPAAAAKASPDLKGIEVTERPLKDLPAGTLYPIQMNWGGDNPTMSLIGTIFPKQLTLDPDVYILDVFPDGKLPGPSPLAVHPKIVRPTNMVTIKEINPTSAPQSKVNPETHSPDMNRPLSKTPPREDTFFCAFNPESKTCVPDRLEAASLVTVIFTIDPEGRRKVTDVVAEFKVEIDEELDKEKKKLKTEDLAPLKDLKGPSTTIMKLNSEPYKKAFGGDKFNFEAWSKHFQETQKGPAAAAKASPDLKGIELFEKPIRDVPKGTLHLLQINWGVENPESSLVSVLFSKPKGKDPEVAVLDIFPEGKAPPGSGAVTNPKIIRPDNMVNVYEIPPTSTTKSKVNPDAYIPDSGKMKGPPRELTFLCAFSPDNKACNVREGGQPLNTGPATGQKPNMGLGIVSSVSTSSSSSSSSTSTSSTSSTSTMQIGPGAHQAGLGVPGVPMGQFHQTHTSATSAATSSTSNQQQQQQMVVGYLPPIGTGVMAHEGLFNPLKPGAGFAASQAVGAAYNGAAPPGVVLPHVGYGAAGSYAGAVAGGALKPPGMGAGAGAMSYASAMSRSINGGNGLNDTGEAPPPNTGASKSGKGVKGKQGKGVNAPAGKSANGVEGKGVVKSKSKLGRAVNSPKSKGAQGKGVGSVGGDKAVNGTEGNSVKPGVPAGKAVKGKEVKGRGVKGKSFKAGAAQEGIHGGNWASVDSGGSNKAGRLAEASQPQPEQSTGPPQPTVAAAIAVTGTAAQN